MPKNNKTWPPLAILTISFFIVIFSIYRIINMALPDHVDNESNDKQIESINKLLENPSKLSYEFTAKTLNQTSGQQTSSSSNFTLTPKINILPIEQQDVLIRIKLLEQKTSILSNELDQIFVYQRPLIFKLWFWIYGLLAWAGSISVGLVLKFCTQKYIIEKYWGESLSD